MPEIKNADFALLFTVFASIFGAITITVLLLQPVNYQSDFTFTPILVGSLYAAVCPLVKNKRLVFELAPALTNTL